MNQSKEQQAANRILILYVLKELALPISNLQLTDILSTRAFLDYFSQQETLSELLETGMITEQTDEADRKFYVITAQGLEAANTLTSLIPTPIRQNFDTHKQEIRQMVKRNWEINATQHIDEQDNHYVRCFVRDGDTFLVDMKILAGNKKLASEMCIGWRTKTEEIYSKLIEQLLS